jgi:hypothetical protein
LRRGRRSGRRSGRLSDVLLGRRWSVLRVHSEILELVSGSMGVVEALDRQF